MPASNTRGSNASRTSVTDRAAGGTQPDTSPPTGSQPSGSVDNNALAPMAANTVKVNATGASAQPQDLPAAASRILARLASGNIIWATVAQIKTLLAYAIGDLASIASGTILGNNGGAPAAPAALTGAQAAALIVGTGTPVNASGTIPLAKITPVSGTDGSIVYTIANGVITQWTVTNPT